MREVKFRGKALDGKWKYGFYASVGNEHYVFSMNGFGFIDKKEIIPKTLSQYIELKDKNEVEIYEGDTVRFVENIGTEDENAITGKVELFRYQWGLMNDEQFACFNFMVQGQNYEFEIIEETK